MTIETSRERFKKAVGILADEKDRIKERLLVAFASQLSGIDRKHDLPKSLLSEFDGVKFALSDADMPYGYGEHAAKKLHDMSEDEASELARTIFSIFIKLHELEPQSEHCV
jgi:hypothetical protein